MKIVSIYLAILFIIFSSCHRKENVLPVSKMKYVMWDMITADAWMKQQFPIDTIIDSSRKNIALYNKIFEINQVSRQDFYASYNYYQKHPNEMKILLDSVAAYGIRKRDTLTNHLK